MNTEAGYLFKGSLRDTELGIGVEVRVIDENENLVGMVCLLCPRDSQDFSAVQELDEASRIEIAIGQVRGSAFRIAG